MAKTKSVPYSPAGPHLIGERVILAPREEEEPLACFVRGSPPEGATLYTVVAADAEAATITIEEAIA
jgi:hypothetical protein